VELIAYCGLYCGACSFKVASEEQNREHLMGMPPKYDYLKNSPLEHCPGCRMDHRCGDCAIRDCALGRHLEYCSLCQDFPCDRLKMFNNDGIPHHAESIGNLNLLKQIGAEEWVNLQNEHWKCLCGERYSWYLQKCRKCSSSHQPTEEMKEYPDGI
jgi:hypothetical protein